MSERILTGFLDRIDARKLEITKHPISYYMTTDVAGNEYVYCLVKIVNNESEIIICKAMTDKKEFKDEVDNLTKYFNAKINLWTTKK